MMIRCKWLFDVAIDDAVTGLTVYLASQSWFHRLSRLNRAANVNAWQHHRSV